MASCLLLHLHLATSVFLFVVAAGLDKNTKEPAYAYASYSTTGNYTGGSQYKRNLDQHLAALPAASSGNGRFYKGSVGVGANAVFGLIICFTESSACVRVPRLPLQGAARDYDGMPGQPEHEHVRRVRAPVLVGADP
jgi:hypothetical protein